MHIDRVELADLIEPRSLARAITARLTSDGPVPVREIALALDIVEVRTEKFDGFEGILLTDVVRSRGAILASNADGDRRARFTIAHELGHFLLERHVLSGPDGFLCRSDDMREARTAQRHQRQEAEANQFAIALLAPKRLTDPHLGREPDLRDAQRLRDVLDISLEAAVRCMIDRRDDVLAAVFTAGDQVRYVVRGKGFPFVNRKPGTRISQATQAARALRKGRAGFTSMSETIAVAWTDRDDAILLEQTRVGKDGHGVTLLQAIRNDLDDEDPDNGSPRELGMPSFR